MAPRRRGGAVSGGPGTPLLSVAETWARAEAYFVPDNEAGKAARGVLRFMFYAGIYSVLEETIALGRMNMSDHQKVRIMDGWLDDSASLLKGLAEGRGIPE